MTVVFNGLQAGNRSGTGVYTAQLARWLPQLAPDLMASVLWPDDEPVPDVPAAARALFRPVRVGGVLRRVIREQMGIGKTARVSGATLVHYPCNVIGLRESLDAVVTIHDLTFLENPDWYRRERAMYNRWGVARSVHRATRIIAVSRATADALIKRLDVRHDRIDVIHNGVDERFVPADDAVKAAVRERYGLQTPFFLFVGTLEPRKNVARLIRAWDRIADACPHALVLVGRRGWKAEPIFEAAQSSRFRDRIKMIGFVPHNDLAGMMGTADAVVYPSLAEGFGIPVAEAMACGVPVLTSNVSSLPEVAGDAALLVDPTDEDAIAEGLRRLAEDGALRRELIEKGLERAKQFTWRRSAEMTISTYQMALGQPTTR